MTDKKTNPLSLSVGEKTTNEVVETPEDKAGTAADKPAEPKEAAPKKQTRKRTTKSDNETSTVDFSQVSPDKLPLSAVSGQIVGSVSLNQGAVPTLNIALQNWIGEAPIVVAASQIEDVENVLKELKKQAREATSKKD